MVLGTVSATNAASQQLSRLSHHDNLAPHECLQRWRPSCLSSCGIFSVLATIPPPWQAIVAAAPTAPIWQQGLSASSSQLIQNNQTGQHHSLNSHDQLQESHAQAAVAISPVHVISWDPSRPWRGPARQPARAAVALYNDNNLKEM